MFRVGGVVHTCKQMFRGGGVVPHEDKCLEEEVHGAHMQTNV